MSASCARPFLIAIQLADEASARVASYNQSIPLCAAAPRMDGAVQYG